MGRFADFLEELVRQHGGTKKDLATELGLTAPEFSRILSEKKPADVEFCLRLAKVTDTLASKVLREAGQGAVAELIEEHFGPAAARRPPVGLRPHELKHMRSWRLLSPEWQKKLEELIAMLMPLPAPRHPSAPRRSPRRSKTSSSTS